MGGFFMVIISCVLIYNSIVDKKIIAENRIVSARILETPPDCNNLGRRGRGGYYKLELNGQIFIKNGNRLVCEKLYGKDKINVYTNFKMDKILFLDEYEKSKDILYGTILMFIGIVIIIKSWKK
ncbi:hypothetical protein D7Z94_18105 [Ulvibacterium marinum]|uniref:DUF3592 domain-containing protein n=2 Tax=Ulvibacterium marinum TaxID=2419782 RepID=A0A3B0C5R5_9FLAO|nr:hypothetical protein D7Z94_18105 [Ulvibacterium marinum]